MPRSTAPCSCAAATLVASLAIAAPVRASDDATEVAGITSAVLLVGADVAFFANAIATTARGGRVEPKVSLAQSIVTAPQVLGVGVGMGIVATESDGSEILAGMAPFGMMVNTLFSHGVWTSVRPEHDVREVFAASSVIGVNAGWTSVLFGYAVEPKLDMRPLGVAMAVTSGIGVSVSLPYALERPGFRAGWIGNAAWAGTLFCFGVAGAAGMLDPSDRHVDPRGPHHSRTDRDPRPRVGFGPVDVVPIVPGDATFAMGMVGVW